MINKLLFALKTEDEEYKDQILRLINWLSNSDIVESALLLILSAALAIYLVVEKHSRRFEITIVILMISKYASILVCRIFYATI